MVCRGFRGRLVVVVAGFGDLAGVPALVGSGEGQLVVIGADCVGLAGRLVIVGVRLFA